MTYEADFGPRTHVTAEPDIIVSSPAELQPLGASWENNWNGTTPTGKGTGDYRVIGLAPGNWSGVTFPYQFPQGVMLMATGTFGNNAHPVSTSSVWNFAGSANVGVFRVRFNGGDRLQVTGSENFWTNRISFAGSNVILAGGEQQGAWSTAYAMKSSGANGIRWTGCEFTRFREYSVWLQPNDARYEYCLHHDMSRDDLKIVSSPQRPYVGWNRWTRDGRTDADAHADWTQVNNGNSCDGLVYEKNIGMKGTNYENDGKISQGIQTGGASITNAIIRQNFLQTKAVNGLRNDGNGSGSVVEYCDVHTLPNLTQDYPIIGGYPTTRNNFACSNPSSSVGSNGLAIDARTSQTAAGAHFRFGFPQKDAPLSHMLAKVGSPAHQDSGGTLVGCYELRDNLEEGGVYLLENWGYPIAYHASRLWNHDDYFATSFDGTYDERGNNANGSPVSTFPQISASTNLIATV